jgi:hypothetical protein
MKVFVFFALALLAPLAALHASEPEVRLAVFDVDATPPVGSAMAYDPVKRLDEMTLRCRGIALLGAGKPIVLCAVDWLGIANEGHDAFRDALAEAAMTKRDRVAVHTLHQHDAPECDFTAERIVSELKLTNYGRYEGTFQRQVIHRAADALRAALATAQPVTHYGWGAADVKQVASNRRILGRDGRVRAERYTATKDAALRAEPEGVIDPQVSLLSFWNGDRPLAVLSYYACHPQSYYRTGVPSPDFPGIARFIRGQAVPEALFVHFDGAGGNIGAGKYNDGARENRMLLAERLAEGMRQSWKATQRHPLTASELDWQTVPLRLPVAPHLEEAKLIAAIKTQPARGPIAETDQLAWLKRAESGGAIDVSCLRVDAVRVLFMPGELFVEYQLAAKAMRRNLHVAMAAYGDYGPGYIGTAAAYREGGYETSPKSSGVDARAEPIIMSAMKRLLEADLRVGIGRADITPQGPIWLSGYAARNRPSEGVVHDLWAKALVIEDSGGGRVVLVTTDLVGLPHELSEEVAARLKTKYGLERSQIVINASHTHSGPVVWPNLSTMFFLSPKEKERVLQYAKRVADDIVRGVDMAMADRAPARVSIGHGTATFAVNRRAPAGSGVQIGVNRKGPVDHDVPVLKIAAPDGRLRAVLLAYACHNTTLGGDNYQICGDYAGFAAAELEKALPGATAMFAMLCGGDQNPDPRGTLELAQRHGKTLADEVRRVLGGEMRPVNGPIRTAREATALQFAPHERATFAKEATSTDKFKQTRARLMLAAYDAGRPMRSLPYPVQAVRFGDDLTLLALAGEVTVEYSLRLKREFPKENLFVMGYANEVRCYIPSLAVLKGGGYEPVTSMIYYGLPGPFAEEVEETIIAACRNVLMETGNENHGAR